MGRQPLVAAIAGGLLVACQSTAREAEERDDGISATAGDSTGGASSSNADGDDDGHDQTKYDVGGGEPVDPPPTLVLAEVPPPPISGGTMILSRDGARIFATDPDRDLVYIVDVHRERVLSTIELPAGCEPGRIVEGTSQQLHIACRRSGQLEQVDIELGAATSSRYACENPRGIAVDPGDESVVVACASGGLVRLGPGGARDVQDVGVELRDVLDASPPVVVSTFRDPHVLTVAANGAIVDERAPPPMAVAFGQVTSLPLGEDYPAETEIDEALQLNTARKTILRDDGGWAMLHQAGSTRGRGREISGPRRESNAHVSTPLRDRGPRRARRRGNVCGLAMPRS